MSAEKKRIRILMSKPGLDGHDRGAKILVLGLRDEGFEVIYTGMRQTPEAIAQAAVQEDVDVVGLSCLAGGHKYFFPLVVELLREKGMDDVMVLGGGIIPDEDIPFLKEKGIKEVWGPGAFIRDIAEYIRKNTN
ncbi:cobalamin B12-binding domain-containing protein [Chloroflexota bacterium]